MVLHASHAHHEHSPTDMTWLTVAKTHASTWTDGIKDRNTCTCAMLKHLGAIKTTAFPLHTLFLPSFPFLHHLLHSPLSTTPSLINPLDVWPFRITSQLHPITLPQHAKITEVPVPGTTCFRLINHQTCRNTPIPTPYTTS